MLWLAIIFWLLIQFYRIFKIEAQYTQYIFCILIQNPLDIEAMWLKYDPKAFNSNLF